VLSDVNYPGWKAYVDGVEQPILTAYYALRSVLPEKPAHEIRFVYYPASFAVGAFISCLAAMLIACGLVAGRRGRA
jgi:uncharacterized membrane protein YfhO